MTFPKTYPFLKKNKFTQGDYSIVPIRYEDRLEIMKWRNEQIYHLRQKEILTPKKQDKYYSEVVSKIFEQKQPDQILFSYLKNDKCIGYGGLVHINWTDKNAEISFIINTELENKEFDKHWLIYLQLIEQVAFQYLGFNKIFTYAFDLRPHLYAILENANFTKEAVLKEHCYIDNKFKDVVIYAKYTNPITIRPISIADLDFTYLLSNDSVIRENSYNTEPIAHANHSNWFANKLSNTNAFYYIGEFNRQPVSFVRIEKHETENIIGIAVAKKFRGKKLSDKFLKLISKEFAKYNHNSKIIAYIKETNIASIKSFEKAGFVFETNCVINNEKSVKYIYGE